MRFLHFYAKMQKESARLGGDILVYYLIAFIVIAIDQYTKWLIISRMDLGESIPVIENILHITSHRNQGAAWEFYRGKWILGHYQYCSHFYCYIYIPRQRSLIVQFFLGVAFGWAIGNFIDRLSEKKWLILSTYTIFGYDFPFSMLPTEFNHRSHLIIILVLLMNGELIERRTEWIRWYTSSRRASRHKN